MQRRRLAILGLGRLGTACAMAIIESGDLALAGIVRRPEALLRPRATVLADIPVVSHPSELAAVHAALICLPSELVGEAAKGLLQQHIPIVEAATFEEDARTAHWQAIDRMARRRGVAAAVGAGWDPGLYKVFDSLFSVMCPEGRTTLHNRPGVSLHHTLAARAIPGVHDGLCAEFKAPDGIVRRYVYVELSPGAAFEAAATAIRADPLFVDGETIVLPVASLADLEGEGHGLVMQRWGRAGGKDHQRFLIEGRFDRFGVAAQVMIAAARALPGLRPGAHPLIDIPVADLQPWVDAA